MTQEAIARADLRHMPTPSILPLKPRQIISALYMAKFVLRDFLYLSSELGSVKACAKECTESPAKYKRGANKVAYESVVEDAYHFVGELRKFAASLRLVITEDRCVYFLRSAPRILDPDVIIREVYAIEAAVERELGQLLFWHIPSERNPYYEAEKLFGDAVSKVFPDAQFDLKEAGNCLAFERGTAAVFHLMRVVEHGIRVLCEKAGVETIGKKRVEDAVWGAIIDVLSAKLRDQKNYQAVLLNLSFIKDVWRNEVMHTKTSYTSKQADAICDIVRHFMVGLAEMMLAEQKKP